MIKKLFVICFVGMLVGLAVLGGVLYFAKDAPDKGKTRLVVREVVGVMTVPDPSSTRQVKVPGLVKAVNTKLLVSEIGGRVAEVYVTDGQKVKKGEPIIRLDATQARATYQNLQMQLAMAQAQLQMTSMGQPPVLEVPNLNNTANFEAQLRETNQVIHLIQKESYETRKAMTPQQRTSLQKAEATLEEVNRLIRVTQQQPVNKTEVIEEVKPPEVIPATPEEATTLSARDRINQITQQMETMKKYMAAHTFYMPGPGKVVHIFVKPNDMVAANTSIAEIATHSKPQIHTHLSPDMIESLKEGQAVLVKVPNSYTNLRGQAQIRFMGSLAAQPLATPDESGKDPKKKADTSKKKIGKIGAKPHLPKETETKDKVQVVVEVTQGNLKLASGDKVDLYFQVAGSGSIWVPQQAVQMRNNHDVVYVIKVSGGKTRVLERAVLIGKYDNDKIEIIEGLSPGEKIVLEGANLLKHNQQVVIKDSVFDAESP